MKRYLIVLVALFTIFNSNAQSLITPTLISPSDMGSDLASLTFKWTPVSGAFYYRLEYDTLNDFSTATKLLALGSAKDAENLYFGHNYYWRVKALVGVSPTFTDSSLWSDTFVVTTFNNEFTLSSPPNLNALITITILDNANLNRDCLLVSGVEFIAGTDFGIGPDAASSADSIASAINANSSLSKFKAVASDSLISLTIINGTPSGETVYYFDATAAKTSASSLSGGGIDSAVIWVTDATMTTDDTLIIGNDTLIEGVDWLENGTIEAATADSIAKAINANISLSAYLNASVDGDSVIVSLSTAQEAADTISFQYNDGGTTGMTLTPFVIDSALGYVVILDNSEITGMIINIGSQNITEGVDFVAGATAPNTVSDLTDSINNSLSIGTTILASSNGDTIFFKAKSSFTTYSLGLTFASSNDLSLSSNSFGSGSALNYSDLNLQWEEVIRGIDNYEMQMDTTAEFNSSFLYSVEGYNVTNEDNYFTVIRLKYDQTYFWRIRGINEADTSDWSDTWSFVTDSSTSLSSPANNTSGLDPLISFNWADYTGSKYTLLIDTTESFSSLVEEELDDLTSSKYDEYSDLYFGTTYYWKVLVSNKSFTGSYSSTWSFTTTDTVLVDSMGGATNTIYPVEIEWTAIEGTTYEYEYGTDATMTTVTTGETEDNTVSLSGLTHGEMYYFRVRAVNEVDQSQWSALDSFLVDITIAVEDINGPSKISIHPNPASNTLFVMGGETIQAIRLTGIDGSVFNVPSICSNNQLNIDISGLSQGVYFISLITESGTTERRFIKL